MDARSSGWLMAMLVVGWWSGAAEAGTTRVPVWSMPGVEIVATTHHSVADGESDPEAGYLEDFWAEVRIVDSRGMALEELDVVVWEFRELALESDTPQRKVRRNREQGFFRRYPTFGPVLLAAELYLVRNRRSEPIPGAKGLGGWYDGPPLRVECGLLPVPDGLGPANGPGVAAQLPGGIPGTAGSGSPGNGARDAGAGVLGLD